MTLIEVLTRFKHLLLVIVFFVLIENISWIIEPTFFGKLLDALIDHFYDNENKVDYMYPLLIWIIVYLINVGGGTLSRLFAGKIYSRIYAEVATTILLTSQNSGRPLSRGLARAELARDYITFIKERLPEITWQFSATFGAIIALFFYDWRIALVCLVVVIPIAIINNLYHRNVLKFQREINDTREMIYKGVEDKDISRIRNCYFSLMRPQHDIARWNAIDYGVIKFILLLIFIMVLFICIDVDKFSTGRIYAVVAYLWTFISSTDYIPTLMESFISVKELSNRLKEQVA
jgi:ABC-type multidrug transport system fused ATPase/permease subunit